MTLWGIPPIVFPVVAFLIWIYLFVSYLPLVESNLVFGRQILTANFYISNLILVLIWFLGGRIWFTVVASTVMLLVAYLLLDLQEIALWIQLITVIIIYVWLEQLSKRLENEKLEHLVNRERIQSRLNLAFKGLDDREHRLNALERKLKRLNYLSEFSNSLKDTRDLRKAADTIVSEVMKLLPRSDQALLYIVNEKTHELGLLSHASKSGLAPIKEKKGNEYDGWVIKRSQPILIEDIQSDFRFTQSPQRPFGFRSMCLLPLVSERKVFGVLHLNAAKEGTFHTDDLRFLDIVADLSSVSLRNILLYEKTKELSIIDSLTECYLFRYMQERLSGEIQRSLRNKAPFSVMMVDIDHFKTYNDSYGHTAGDRVLKGIADVLKNSVGPTDIVGRYGGEEFIVIMPQKGFKEAFKISETIRKKIQNRSFNFRKPQTKVTISSGVAVYPQNGTSKEELLLKADKYLYQAKHEGRNRTCGSI